ncbi:MAG: glucosidase [Planctomycetes bacterium]|nr:glucosidase [Planctomycetota bacterium]
MSARKQPTDPESVRLEEDARRERNWKRWGPYLSERQWGTVREDYSGDGSAWDYFPYEHSRSRAYRWGEDGLLGFCDRQCRLAFGLALWNGHDPYLKERLFGLTGPQGNHGEDVKEEYYYLEATPTSSWCSAVYRYPQRAFPYAQLLAENARRTREQPEYELVDTGVLDDSRVFELRVEYAKCDPEDLQIRIHVTNLGPESATLHVLPTLWARNTWSWGNREEGSGEKPVLHALSANEIGAEVAGLGSYRLACEGAPELCFTDNETNTQLLFGTPSSNPYVKDAFHRRVVEGDASAVNPARTGTKAAAHYVLELAAGQTRTLRLRLREAARASGAAFGPEFDALCETRRAESESFFGARLPIALSAQERSVVKQAYAGLLWSKQFYHYIVQDWLRGDPAQPAPPPERAHGRNHDWPHLYNRDVLSMPDTWEYPWYAAWDLAFHMLPMARVDPQFAKDQLLLFLREWYMHPSGQIPAYEWALSDVNPPVHAWACWRVYKMTGARGERDLDFLERCFQKLLFNFTWWVNRKDPDGNHLFSGGFLGLDNIGVFDRSAPLPEGGHLQQADGTAWMAFYCNTMLAMALELAPTRPAYEDVASKFFEHFVAICDAMNTLGGTGLWDETDGFYYDRLASGGESAPLKVRSMVGVIPLLAVEVLEQSTIDRCPGFKKRMQWFLEHRADLAAMHSYLEVSPHGERRLLAIPSKERLARVLRYALDESEFLSPFGLRSLSRVHGEKPFVLELGEQRYRVDYEPGESRTQMFGGNSNWRGPVWFPLNYLLVEALQRYHHFYGDEFTVECPAGSGVRLTLSEVADELCRRMLALFLPDAQGHRPCHGGDERYASDPLLRERLLFHEYFHGETGKGLGASHQTGWTALVTRCAEELAHNRSGVLGASASLPSGLFDTNFARTRRGR